MNINNLKKARELEIKFNNINKAIEDCNEALSKIKEAGKEYSGRFSEYNDGSGFSIRLENTGIIQKTIEFIKTSLEQEQAKVVEEIGTL